LVKTSAEFNASVYLRAKQRQAAIRQRNRRILQAGASAGALAVVLATTLVLQSTGVRGPLPAPAASSVPGTWATTQRSAEPQAEEEVNVIDMSLLLREAQGAGAVKTVHLNNRADEYEALSAYQSEAGLEDGGNLAIFPIPGQTETVESKAELWAYLEKLHLEADFGSAVAAYDDRYFASNTLVIGAVEIVDLAKQTERVPPETTETTVSQVDESNAAFTSFPEQAIVEPTTAVADSHLPAPAVSASQGEFATLPGGSDQPTATLTTSRSAPAFTVPESSLQTTMAAGTSAAASTPPAKQTSAQAEAAREEIQGLLLVQAPKWATAD
jgi:hypothetical protein